MVSKGTILYRIPKNSIFKKGKQKVHHITNSKSTFQTKLHKIWTKEEYRIYIENLPLIPCFSFIWNIKYDTMSNIMDQETKIKFNK
ncbi:hypothetical protein BpHYR1_029253 [Brachionus plicatilis]|uniref:Uncharacterized protein n=1 Tax=Brachionus plicatilis TaxID=10195 RepID=A0A3M7S2G5_BRAPC|nr:hypothetical protein BpHYR1_029253 [Brachionus plicatilis]